MQKILVIEADTAARDARLAYLLQQGYKTLLAEDISTALTLARQHHPDLLLCGLDLSGGDTLGLLQALQSKTDLSAIPVVVLTSQDEVQYRRRCVALGADDYLVVPFSDEDLQAAIASRLRKREALTGRYNTLMRHTAERLNRLAHYDSLTDLPNYRLLRQRLTQAIQRARSGNQRVALFSLSLDRLRQVNNTLGYPAGDALLRAMARRLMGILPRSTAVARLTGNQFAIVLAAPRGRNELVAIAERIFDSLSHSFSLPGQEVFVTASIGIAVFPEDTHDINTLLRQADAALAWAQGQKSHAYRFYHPDMPMVSNDTIQLETWLRYALERQEFRLLYQPKYHPPSDTIQGAEALIRWRHPEAGEISPGRFIPLAEETGLIVPIGAWVLQSVCQQGAEWLHQGHQPLSLAVNLSSVQLNHARLVQTLNTLFKTYQMPPNCLELEVTETALMQDVDSAIALLRELKSLGVKIAMDDFGTGYSSLGYLRQMPIDTLKIDTCFIRNLPQEPKNQVIVQQVIAMAHALDLQVVAEGVETQAEMELLVQYGCDLIQGYWVSHAIAPEELATKL